MLRMIAGLEQPDSGTITLGGRVVNGTPARDRDGNGLQFSALYPHLSVYEKHRLRTSTSGTPRPRDRCAGARGGRNARTWRCPGEAAGRTRGGQRQWVALGRAIVPAGAVSARRTTLAARCSAESRSPRVEIKALQQRLSATMLYVHDQPAMMLGRRVAVMNKGRLHQVAEPATVYERPADRFVAGFLGTPAMNFFNGRIDSSAGGIARVRSGVEIRVLPPTATSL